MSSEFIWVYGEDPNEKGRKTHFYLNRGLIAKIVPIWEVGEDGQRFSATSAHEKAKVYVADILDTAGKHYSCGDRGEMLKLIGQEEFERFRGKTPEEKRIGFDARAGS
jgi:hypothetical protein